MKEYSLEVFLVDSDKQYIGRKYPCAWMPWAFDDVTYSSNNGSTYTFALQAQDLDSLHWDYLQSTGGRGPVTFGITATEAQEMRNNRATAWGVVSDDNRSLMQDYNVWVDEHEGDLVSCMKRRWK